MSFLCSISQKCRQETTDRSADPPRFGHHLPVSVFVVDRAGATAYIATLCAAPLVICDPDADPTGFLLLSLHMEKTSNRPHFLFELAWNHVYPIIDSSSLWWYIVNRRISEWNIGMVVLKLHDLCNCLM